MPKNSLRNKTNQYANSVKSILQGTTRFVSRKMRGVTKDTLKSQDFL